MEPIPKIPDRSGKNVLLLWLGAIALIAGLQACGGNEYDEELPQTEILAFTIEPSENLMPGDTVTMTCKIKDSLDTRFNFYWSVDYGFGGVLLFDAGDLFPAEKVGEGSRPRRWTQNRNWVKWIVPDCTGYFSATFRVIPDNFEYDGFITVNKTQTIIINEE